MAGAGFDAVERLFAVRAEPAAFPAETLPIAAFFCVFDALFVFVDDLTFAAFFGFFAAARVFARDALDDFLADVLRAFFGAALLAFLALDLLVVFFFRVAMVYSSRNDLVRLATISDQPHGHSHEAHGARRRDRSRGAIERADGFLGDHCFDQIVGITGA